MDKHDEYAEVLVFYEGEVEEGVPLEHRLPWHRENMDEGSRYQTALAASTPRREPPREIEGSDEIRNWRNAEQKAWYGWRLLLEQQECDVQMVTGKSPGCKSSRSSSGCCQFCGAPRAVGGPGNRFG